MKKILLSVATLFASFAINAQALTTQNFNDLTVGDLSADLTGAAAGQGGWIVATDAAKAKTSDFQVVNVGTDDNALLLTAEAGVTAAGTDVRYAVQDLASSWTNRTAGNDKIVCSYSFFTGTAAASTNANLNVRLYNSAGGMIAGITYNNVTRAIRAQVWRNTASTPNTGTFYLNKNGTSDLVLTADTWYTFALIFDKVTGDVYFAGTHADIANIKYPGGTTANTGANVGKDVGEFALYTFTGAGNAASEEFLIDDVFARAQADTNLSVKENVVAAQFSVFPNPANNVVNIANADNILVNKVTVTDLNGRTVKNVSFDNVSNVEVNVSDLASGLYIMNITSDKGTATKKFVKN